MAKFDPPSDPYGNEKSCRICDQPLEWNYLIREWECLGEHERRPTPLAVDETICACSHDVYENVVSPGNCMACGKPFRH